MDLLPKISDMEFGGEMRPESDGVRRLVAQKAIVDDVLAGTDASVMPLVSSTSTVGAAVRIGSGGEPAV